MTAPGPEDEGIGDILGWMGTGSVLGSAVVLIVDHLAPGLACLVAAMLLGEGLHLLRNPRL